MKHGTDIGRGYCRSPLVLSQQVQLCVNVYCYEPSGQSGLVASWEGTWGSTLEGEAYHCKGL